MLRQVITCDHCGAAVNNADLEMKLPYDMRRPDAQFASDYVHGCSKEHLGLALAKIFELPVNVDAADALAKANARITELELRNADTAVASHEQSAACQKVVDDLKRRAVALEARTAELDRLATDRGVICDHFRKRITELEARLAPVDTNGKTPGQVLKTAIAEALLDGEPHERQAERGALAVLRAFGNAPPSTDTEHGLNVVRAPFAGNDHPHEVGSCSYCDTAELTTTKPPVKPLEALATYWENGAKHDAMHVDYRGALRDCAKELRETLASITVPTKPTKPEHNGRAITFEIVGRTANGVEIVTRGPDGRILKDDDQ